MSKGLSKLQHRILAAIANATVNTYDTNEPTETKYSAVFAVVADYWFAGVPALPGERRHYVAKAAFSRAVWSLIRRGLVEGVALAWAAVPTGEVMRWQGGGRRRRGAYGFDDRPRIKMLGLTEAGWQAVARTETHGDERGPVDAASDLGASRPEVGRCGLGQRSIHGPQPQD